MSKFGISNPSFPSPAKTMGVLLLTLFGIEMAIMQGFGFLPEQKNPYLANLLDAVLLTGIFSPVLYHYIFKPFRNIAATHKSLAENVLSQMVDGVFLVAARLVVHSFNDSAQRIFGYSATEVVGREANLFIKDASLQQLAEAIALPVTTAVDRQAGRNCVGTDRNGREIPLEVSLNPVRLDGGWMWLWIVRDLTEQRNLEHQLRHAQKMEALGTLAGGVAHDFNNILTVIMGFCSLGTLKLDKQDPLKNNLDQIMAAAERAAALTNSLLAYSRKQAMNPKPLDLNLSVCGIEKFLTRLIGENIELLTKVCPEKLVVMADGGQIEQVLMNLATNARDAMTGRGALVIQTAQVLIDQGFVRMHGFGRPGAFAQISVSDTGSGMDAATREKVFEPFFTTKELGSGTGLGLSIVYGIIKQHEGYINIYSEPGKGTTFNVYLPLIEGDLELLEPPPPEMCGGTETILLAEDDDSVRSLVEVVLSGSGYRVIVARDGADAMEKFREHADCIDLLVLDVVMPKKNGKETLEEICAVKPGVKTIFISGYTADIIDRNGLIGTGLNLITKPLQANQLLAKVREVLDAA